MRIKLLGFCLAVGSALLVSNSLSAEELTVVVGTQEKAPQQLVNHTDDWRYRKGTNEPPANWNSAADATLDSTWNTGPGGIGYGDGDDGTVLTDMQTNYVSVYIRQSFEITAPLDTNLILRLTMDWDDGYVAYLDGVEISRSSNVPGTAGTPHPYDMGVVPDHSAVVEGGTLAVINLGPVGDRLGLGTHILAVQGINGDAGSSDLTVNADLFLVDTTVGESQTGEFFSLTTENTISLTGSNTVANSTRVVVNGYDAAYNAADGTWSKVQTLVPGMNRLHIAALDVSGAVLNSTSIDMVYQETSVETGGTLNTDTTWSLTNGVVRVTSNLTIESGATLTIEEGAVVLLSPDVLIQAQADSTLNVLGSDPLPVFFLPSDGETPWDELSAIGTNATMSLSYAEIVAAQVRILADAVITIEDCVLRDLYGRQMIEAFDGVQFTIRRTHFNRYAQTHYDDTPVLIEGCLIENVTSDATDFQSGSLPVIVRNSTYRFGAGGNTDAVDSDFSEGLIVENCLIRDFPDKAISVADLSHGAQVRNNLILNSGLGISCYASSNCVFTGNTIVDCDFGLALWERSGHPGPGFASATNNILWGSLTNVSVTEAAELEISYSDIGGAGIYPGQGNINDDPLFRDPTNQDYSLQAGSPALGTGLGGADMGVNGPVGGMPPSPFDLGVTTLSSSEIRLMWSEDADNETGFVIERTSNEITWETVAMTEAGEIEFIDASLVSLQQYGYRVRATNAVGLSRASNVAISTTLGTPVPATIVGGTLPEGLTIWSTNMGTILVQSSVTVPADSVLRIDQGVEVRMTEGVSIQAVSGGTINIFGTAQNLVTILPPDGATWGAISASGEGSSLTIRFADISGGRVRFLTDVNGLIEDSYIHHYSPGGSSIINSVAAQTVTMRRSHVAFYHETLFQRTLMLIDGCLFENAINPSSDALDFDGANPGSVIRQTTFRNGTQTNTDAIDLGPGGEPTSVLIEDCIMHRFTDKGVSIGEIGNDTLDITVRNCLIYNVTIGVQVKDTTAATIEGCTIADCEIGIHGFEKPSGNPGGGILTNLNNIVYNALTPIMVEEGPLPTIITVDFCNTFGTNWPGTGNINADPQFFNTATRDYRLSASSPSIGTGLGGVNMGVTYPVGGVPAAPTNLTLSTSSPGDFQLSWNHTSDYESGFVVETTSDGLNWTVAAIAPANATGISVTGLSTEMVHVFRVLATNFIAQSFVSNLVDSDGGIIDSDLDGMPDEYELSYGFNPGDPADADLDADYDIATNLEEFLAGTNPRNALDVLKFRSVRLPLGTPADVEFRFRAISNKSYTIEYHDDRLTNQVWSTLTNIPPSPVTRNRVIHDYPPTGTRVRYYRLFTP